MLWVVVKGEEEEVVVVAPRDAWNSSHRARVDRTYHKGRQGGTGRQTCKVYIYYIFMRRKKERGKCELFGKNSSNQHGINI